MFFFAGVLACTMGSVFIAKYILFKLKLKKLKYQKGVIKESSMKLHCIDSNYMQVFESLK